MEVEDTKFVQQPQQKFIRPVHGYMDFLDVQEELPHGGDVLYLERFRVSKDAVALILQLSKPHLPATFDTRLVLLVTIQWLASSVSVRSQEQMLFQDHNHVTLAYYRQLGVRAITKGLVDGGFYGSGPHEPTATACAPAVKHFVKSIQPSTSVLVLWMVPTSPSRCLRRCKIDSEIARATRRRTYWVSSTSWEGSWLSLRVVKAAHLTAIYTARRSLKEASQAVTYYTLVMLGTVCPRCC
ncbi:hypothetical protein H257_15020 [Aphanomyces astaci]|uniref:Uncharacterized protein n=1 Tax=Aphanomyces astaci TaxID=112090 RepID=W4FQG5_APHAT|nr:hypothetical protein H257_15020 [Aphanomyces astaci]ETV69191.1 hypothetical protein H257_15020 [Aphanomyces astaci]|eukprot:XP_009841293.1 hypothetical protein H257_15020 [Aphanomyces astaci]